MTRHAMKDAGVEPLLRQEISDVLNIKWCTLTATERQEMKRNFMVQNYSNESAFDTLHEGSK